MTIHTRLATKVGAGVNGKTHRWSAGGNGKHLALKTMFPWTPETNHCDKAVINMLLHHKS